MSFSVSPTQLLHWDLSNCTQIDLFPFIQKILNSFQRKHNASAEYKDSITVILRKDSTNENSCSLEMLQNFLYHPYVSSWQLNFQIILDTFYSDIVLQYFLNCAIQNMPDLEIRREKTTSGCVCVCVYKRAKILPVCYIIETVMYKVKTQN